MSVYRARCTSVGDCMNELSIPVSVLRFADCFYQAHPGPLRDVIKPLFRRYVRSKNRQKAPVRTHPSLRIRPRSGWPLLNFVMNQIFLETRIIRLSDGEEIMPLAFFVLIQYRSVTDGQTDGRTDGHLCSGYTSACIACYANALVIELKTSLLLLR